MNWLNPFLILLAALLAVFLESSFDGFRTVFRTQIDLLPALMVYTSLTHGIFSIAALAVFGGLWFDSLSANPLGASVLPLFFIGLINLQSRSFLLRENSYAQFIFGMSASAVAPVLTLLIIYAVGENPIFGWASLWQWIVMAIFGGAMTPVCFQFFDRISRALNYQPQGESSFRPDREIKRGRS